MSRTFGYRTLTHLTVLLKKFNIGVKWVKTDDPEEFRKAIDENTKGVYIESIGNPKYNVPNIAEISKVGISRIFRLLFRLTGDCLGRSRGGDSPNRRQHFRHWR